jgi:hypothetical protein
MDVTVVDSNLDNVLLSLKPGFDIDGIVKSDDGAPVPRVSIELLESSDGSRVAQTTQTDTDSKFRFHGLGAGNLLLNVVVPDGTYVKLVTFDGQDVTRSPIAVRGSGALSIVLSSSTGSVSGTLRGDKGEPMGGYPVTVWPKIPDLGSLSAGVKQAITDQNGNFRFPSLAPGDYYLAAWDDIDSGLAQSSEFLRRFNTDASEITITGRADAKLATIVIPSARIEAEIEKLP